MTPGTVLFDPQFEFHDGTVGRKLFIVLNDGKDGIYIVIKTTSQPKHKGRDEGCQLKDRYPDFFVKDSSSCLDGDSWLLLNEFYELKASDLLKKSFIGQIKHIGVLSKEMLIELLACALESMDISVKQAQVLQEVLNSL